VLEHPITRGPLKGARGRKVDLDPSTRVTTTRKCAKDPLHYPVTAIIVLPLLLQVSINEGPGPEDLNTTPTGGDQEMPVSTDDDARLGGHGTGKEDVIVGVGTDGFRKRGRLDDMRTDGDKIEQWEHVNTFVFLAQPKGNFSIFSEDLQAHGKLNFPIAPGLKDLQWWPAEEDAGHQNVGVQYDLHRFLRT